jgi:hypothetical protein
MSRERWQACRAGRVRPARRRRHSGQGEAGVHAGEYEDAHESPASSVDLPPGRRLGVPTLARVQQPRDTEKDLELPAPPPWYRRRLLFGQGQVPLRRGAAPAGGPTAGRRPAPAARRPSPWPALRPPATPQASSHAHAVQCRCHSIAQAAAWHYPPDTAQGRGNPPAGQAGAESPPIPPSHAGRAPNSSSEAGTHPGSPASEARSASSRKAREKETMNTPSTDAPRTTQTLKGGHRGPGLRPGRGRL